MDTPTPGNSPMGENTTVSLVIPKDQHQQEYQKVLTSYVAQMTLPGFRKGKAPRSLVESSVGGAKIVEHVLEHLLPDVYSKAIAEKNLIPLVQPQIQAKKLEPQEDWEVDAITAIAPTVSLGDWKAILKKVTKDLPKKEDKEADSDYQTRQLSFVFGELIKEINPKIPPLLLENETRKQLEELARHLASHRIDLDRYLKSLGKTIEELQQEYMANALATLQLEFVLLAITNEVKPEVSDKDISEFAGDTIKKLDGKVKTRMQTEAKTILERRKVIEMIKESVGIAQS